MLRAVGDAGKAPGGKRSFLRDRGSNAGWAPSGPAAAVKNPFVAIPRSYEQGVWRQVLWPPWDLEHGWVAALLEFSEAKSLARSPSDSRNYPAS
jgi:hypothetical protein